MTKVYDIRAQQQRKEISQSGKDFTDCEEISQLREAVGKLLESCEGLSKQEIAQALNVAASKISMWRSKNGDMRDVKIEEARKLLRLVKQQPRMILESIEAVEEAIERDLERQFGKGRDPNTF